MSDRIFKDKIEKLRSEERIRMLEIDRVVTLSLENIKAESILDVGTGSALFAEAFTMKNLKVSGIDINKEMITVAQEFVPGANFLHGEAEAIPFPGNSFDIVFLGHVLHETGSIDNALAEAKRVAKQRVIILEWPYRQEEHGPPLAHRIKPEELIQTAEKTGFVNIEIIRLNHMNLFRIGKP